MARMVPCVSEFNKTLWTLCVFTAVCFSLLFSYIHLHTLNTSPLHEAHGNPAELQNQTACTHTHTHTHRHRRTHRHTLTHTHTPHSHSLTHTHTHTHSCPWLWSLAEGPLIARLFGQHVTCLKSLDLAVSEKLLCTCPTQSLFLFSLKFGFKTWWTSYLEHLKAIMVRDQGYYSKLKVKIELKS